MLNRVFLIGRLGQDPEMRYTPSGAAVTNFSIATDRKWRDKQGALQEETTWHDIVCWNKTAEFIAEYASKGKLVFVEGRIQKRSWEDQNGQKRITVEVNAQNIQLLEWGDRSPSSGGNRSNRQSQSKPAPQSNNQTMDTEDDVPF